MGRVVGVEILVEDSEGKLPPKDPRRDVVEDSAADPTRPSAQAARALPHGKAVLLAAAIDDVVQVFDVHTLLAAVVPTIDCRGDASLERLVGFLRKHGAWGFHRLVGYTAIHDGGNHHQSMFESMQQRDLFSTWDKLAKYVDVGRQHVTVTRGDSEDNIIGSFLSPLRATLRVKPEQYMRCLCAGSGDAWLAAGLSSGAVAIWNRQAHDGLFKHVDMDALRDAPRACTAEDLRNAAAAGTLAAAELHGHAGDVNSLALCPSGSHLASAADDGTVRVWNLSAAPHTVPPPVVLAGVLQRRVTACVWLDDRTLATASKAAIGSGRVCAGILYHIAPGNCLCRFSLSDLNVAVLMGLPTSFICSVTACMFCSGLVLLPVQT
eukprot:m.1326936 g.1326936  ORF g.1326936 m.1326936 type:complete len:378 (-) comp24858_c0_seq4:1938-3071(-)